MAFERPITIKEAIENIYRKKYLLPAIQREFVWEADQIELLFDSMMRGYPIGSFLFWMVEPSNTQNYQFYEFIRDYHRRDNKHNPKANISGEAGITAILDGQQRLTALYIGLRGSYASKLARKRWDNNYAFPKRELYLNLLSPSRDYETEYDFKFLTQHEARAQDSDAYWFRVGDILGISETFELNDYLINNGLNTVEKDKAIFANRTLFRLHRLVHDEAIINYFMEQDESLDKVLNIFIRVNSGGTKLSYSDLLLSIATAQWRERDAREEITRFVDEINRVGDGFDFSKDLVLKSCLILSDFRDIGFKVDNFNASNMLKIESNWEGISSAIRAAVILVDSFGYNVNTLTSANALIPIAYYLYNIGNPPNFAESSRYEEDRVRIRKWLAISLVKRTFGGTADDILRQIRQVLASNDTPSFPIEGIADSLRGGIKSLTFTEEDIDNLFYYNYAQTYTFSTLALLYPSLDFRNKFHVDHIYPKRLFTKKQLRSAGIPEHKIDFYLDNYNRVANLQLLEGIPNQEKSGKDFEGWLLERYPQEADRRDFMRRHFIPDVDLSLANFPEFIRERTALLKQEYRSLLNIQGASPAHGLPATQLEDIRPSAATPFAATTQPSSPAPAPAAMSQPPSHGNSAPAASSSTQGEAPPKGMENAPDFLRLYQRCSTHTQRLFDAIRDKATEACPKAEAYYTKDDFRLAYRQVFCVFHLASTSLRGGLMVEQRFLPPTRLVALDERPHSSRNVPVQRFYVRHLSEVDEVVDLIKAAYQRYLRQ